VVHGCAKSAVGTSGIEMPRLFRGHLEVVFVHGGLFAGGRACVYAVRAAVEAHAIKSRGMVSDMLVVDVPDHMDIDVCHCAVVIEVVAAPVAAKKSHAGVAEAVVNAAIEAYSRSPIAGIPYVHTVAECPVTRGPEQACFRRKHPRTGNPVVAGISPGPVARSPDITGTGAKRLRIHGQRRRSDPNCYAHRDVGAGRRRGHHHGADAYRERTHQSCDSHGHHLSDPGWELLKGEAGAARGWSGRIPT